MFIMVIELSGVQLILVWNYTCDFEIKRARSARLPDYNKWFQNGCNKFWNFIHLTMSVEAISSQILGKRFSEFPKGVQPMTFQNTSWNALTTEL